MQSFQKAPENVAGKSHFITDDTLPLPLFEFIEPFIVALGYRSKHIPIPMTVIYLLLLIYEFFVWLLKPIFPIRSTQNSHLIYGHTFSGKSLSKDTGYHPRYTPEESFQRTLRCYLESPPK